MYLWGVLIKSLYTLGDYPLDEVSTKKFCLNKRSSSKWWKQFFIFGTYFLIYSFSLFKPISYLWGASPQRYCLSNNGQLIICSNAINMSAWSFEDIASWHLLYIRLKTSIQRHIADWWLKDDADFGSLRCQCFSH